MGWLECGLVRAGEAGGSKVGGVWVGLDVFRCGCVSVRLGVGVGFV